MALPAALQHLALPVIASPMFIVSYPELVLAQCKAGIVGSFPALNARPAELLDKWLTQIGEGIGAHKVANSESGRAGQSSCREPDRASLERAA